jgi:hypothetical protein
VLALASPGVEDNFFELGGTSLALVEVQARVAEAFAVEVPVVELFRHPTIRALARVVVRGDGAADAGLERARGAARVRRELLGRRRAGAGVGS